MNTRLADIIARETYGESYRLRKYRLDDFVREYPEQLETAKVWQKTAEPRQKNKYININSLSRQLAKSDEQIL